MAAKKGFDLTSTSLLDYTFNTHATRTGKALFTPCITKRLYAHPALWLFIECHKSQGEEAGR